MFVLVQDFLHVHAKESPESLMIQNGEETITYREMDSFSNAFAVFLKEKGVKRQDNVAFFMEKSINSFK